MEIKGIITGIGNTITPEIDAALNDFIVGENTIIQGLTLNNGVLQAGMCQLCGYRGVMSSNITGLSEVNDRLIYGRFVISFGEFSREQQYDEFSIYTTKVKPIDGVINPSSITAAGIYYLELYADGASSLPPYRERENYQYPKTANISDRAKTLIDGGIISDLATTPTEKNEDGSVKVDLHKTQPNRVANTQYVHRQIQEELRYEGVVEGAIYMSGNVSGDPNRIKLSLQRKAWYVVCDVTYNSDVAALLPNLRVNFPNGYKPRYNNVAISFPYVYYTDGKYKVFFGTIIANVNGTVSTYFSEEKHSYSTLNEATNKAKTYVFRTGYECQ